MFKVKDLINKNEKIISKTKDKLRKNKKSIYIGLGCMGAFLFPVSIYFTQTAFFYNMEKIEKKEVKNLDTIYSYNASISSRYKRTIPWTYKTNIPIERYAWADNPWYKKNYNDESLMKPARQLLVDESKWMMDDAYLKEQVAKRTLKKHPAADYQYGYERRIPNSAPAVVKNFNIDLERSGTLTTGLYIAPGEIVKINFKNLTNEQIKKLNVSLIIADNEFDNYDINITKKDAWFNRMPILRKELKVETSYFEFGTPFGGMVNLSFNGNPLGDIKNIGVSIKGAIEALHYVHGYTTEKEWYRLVKEAKAPIAEIASDYVSFIAPKHVLSNFRPINNKTPPPNPLDPKYYPYKSMDLINKLAMDGHYTIDRAKNKLPKIRFLTTAYVRTGSAYATPGGWRVVQPWHWVQNILDYDSFLNNGYWGTMHEMNHHNQDWFAPSNYKWGFSEWGESSNNAITIGSYIKFTNVLSKRDGLETQGEKGIVHEHKVNGYISQRYNNIQFNKPLAAGKNTRSPFDTDYSVVMANFGAEGFQETVRSYKNGSIKNALGNIVQNLPGSNEATPPEKYQNARFIDRISQITGYNWSQYFLDTKLITEEDATKINEHLKTLSGTSSDANQKFKPYAPLYSFYASDVRYDSTSPTTTYKKVGAPFFIDKKYFNSGYNFKLEELLETSKKVVLPDGTNNQTRKEEEFYTISNVKLVSQPKYGQMTEITSGSAKKVFNYKPDLKKINEIDEFEYSADVERKTMNPPNGSKDLLSAENQKITVNFKVKIRLDGNKTEIEVPSNLGYQQYRSDLLISEFDKLADIKMENNKVNGKLEHSYYQVGKDVYNEKHLLQKYPEKSLQVRDDDKNVVLNIYFKNYINLNSMSFYNAIDLDATVSGLQIEDISNSNAPKVLLKTPYLRQEKAIYTFPKISTNKLKVTFLKSINGEAAKKAWIKLKRIDFGMFDETENILPANSQLIQTVGDWRKGFGGARYNNDSLLTINPFTSIYLGIRNTDSFAIYGAKDKNYGKFDLYIDNKFYTTIDTSNSYRTENVALAIMSEIKANYGDGNHIIKLVSKSTKPIEIQGFNLDSAGEAFFANANDPYYILVSVIPLISILLIITAIVVTIVILKKRKVKK